MYINEQKRCYMYFLDTCVSLNRKKKNDDVKKHNK